MADPAVLAKKQAQQMKALGDHVAQLTSQVAHLADIVGQVTANQPTPLSAELLVAEAIVAPALSDEQLAQVAGVVAAAVAPLGQALADIAQRLPAQPKGGK